MTKGCIYYTDNELDPKIMGICQEQLKRAFKGDIVSASLKPIDFGKNIVLSGSERGYYTMLRQILTALKLLETDVVFFTEHDVLYHPSHFDFTPTNKNIYYYNVNDWRWDYPKDRVITYDHLTSLSMMCSDRQLAIGHYSKRLLAIEKNGLNTKGSREPEWARKWGYEPGTKRPKRGGFSDESCEYWRSEYPNIDIRHNKTFSRRKVTLGEFKHPPAIESWKETTLDKLEGWNIKELWKLQ